ncbi:MAG: winged helix-turn-helix transcriptional regulator [Verrucomicrobiae bacterium]|nr:winged helix-turn-helix transcriptional regulator [Verrucomicrobiae bacterium]
MKGDACLGALKAISDGNRIRILRHLLEGECTVGALAAALDISQYNVSRHLSILRSAGLVSNRKAGRERIYCVAKECRIRTSAGLKVMDLGCCTFRIDEMPE